MATVTDPKALVTKTFFDALGRRTAAVENYLAGANYWTVEPLSPKSRAADECRITATTYDMAGNTVTLTAVDPDHDGNLADNQVTV